MLKEILIGFDVREMWLDTDTFWDEQRRNTFLLKQDVEKPISVDPVVWASVFDIDVANPESYFAKVQRKEIYRNSAIWDEVTKHHKALQLPQWRGRSNVLWDKLSILKQHVTDGWSDSWKPCCLIAVTQVIDTSDEDTKDLLDYPFIEPAEIGKSWQFLGYDVADSGFTGFITNAGYRDDEKESLTTQWRDIVN